MSPDDQKRTEKQGPMSPRRFRHCLPKRHLETSLPPWVLHARVPCTTPRHRARLCQKGYHWKHLGTDLILLCATNCSVFTVQTKISALPDLIAENNDLSCFQHHSSTRRYQASLVLGWTGLECWIFKEWHLGWLESGSVVREHWLLF